MNLLTNLSKRIEKFLSRNEKMIDRSFANEMIKKPKDLSSHWIAIDGKNLGMLEHDGAGLAHYCRSSASAEKWGLSTDKGEYWIAPVLRAALISSEQRLVLLQKAIPQKTGEATNFGDFIKELQRAYGRTELLRGFTADAGLCSLEKGVALLNLRQKGLNMASNSFFNIFVA